MVTIQADPWIERWQTGKTGWDLKGPHPYIEELFANPLLRSLLPSGSRIYVPGCGKAHDAAWLAAQGYEVSASDIVAEAVTAAKALYHKQERLHMMQDDALVMMAGKPYYQGVFDRAMLCALDEPLRTAYIDACVARLASGGLFVSIPFTQVKYPLGKTGGPPFALTRDQLFDLCEKQFTLVHYQDKSTPSLDGVIQSEALMVWRKR